MVTPTPDETHAALEQSRSRGASAPSRLLPLVVGELKALAAHYLRHERKDHTLQPTELVHEAYLKLIDQTRIDWQGRTHFFAVAAAAVRQVLVDHARAHRAQKRGRGLRSVTLHDFDAVSDAPSMDILSLDEALVALGKLSARQHQVVELRFFGGLRVEDIAQIMNVSPRTVKGLWRAARAWLIQKMQESGE
jgi:RNA polymerase sigma factor (TIGR02999 family)